MRAKSRLKQKSFSKRTWIFILISCFSAVAIATAFGWIKRVDEAYIKAITVRAYQEVVIKEVEVIREVKIAKVTAYSCGGLETEAEILMNCPSLKSGTPKTANGTEPIPNKTMACDPANMGKTFELKGIGRVTCTDTGSAIKGAGRFDLYLATVEEARHFSVKYIEYWEVN